MFGQDVYAYLEIGVMLAVVASILYGLAHETAARLWQADDRSRTIGIASSGLIAWSAASIALSMSGFYRGDASRIPTIQIGILAPLVIGAFLIARSETASRIIDIIPQQRLIGVQLFRLMGFTFLILYAAGKLPGAFALPAGLGDVAIGLAAPIVATLAAREPLKHRYLIKTWNLLGLADLIIAVGMGFLSSPSPVQLVAFDLPNRLISEFPLVLIPTFLVPLAVLLHVASLIKLSRNPALTGVSHAKVEMREVGLPRT